jgi:hypothetical protein
MNRNRSRSRWLVGWLALAMVIISFSGASFGQVFVSVRIGPPPLPVYAQPLCPGPGYYWTPGYWAWNDDDGYYWVPGTWVVAPVGLLWTPGYWGWGGGFYAWHAGYWGPHIGFYGGINYGFGYTGIGFVGGEWRGREFFYNRSVTNVSVTNVTNVYNKTVIVNHTTVNNVSFNGGTGGVKAEPRPEERAAEREHHESPLALQTQHEHMASQNRQNFASENHGRPAVAATARPADFSSHSAIGARAAGGEYHAPAMSPKEARGPSNPGYHPFTPANSNNANRTEGRSTPTPQDKSKSNEGFRPFAPPSNSKNSSNSREAKPSGNDRTFSPQISNHSPSSTAKPSENYRPFTPPNSNHSQEKNSRSNPTYQEHGSSGNNPMYEPKDKTRTPEPTAPKTHTSEPAPKQHQSAPPAPSHHQSTPAHQPSAPKAPKDEHHKPGKGR